MSLTERMGRSLKRGAMGVGTAQLWPLGHYCELDSSLEVCSLHPEHAAGRQQSQHLNPGPSPKLPLSTKLRYLL